MHLAGAVGSKSGSQTTQIFKDRYSNKRILLNQMLPLLHRKLCDRIPLWSNMLDTERRRQTRSVNAEEQVQQFINVNPNSSTRAIAQQLGGLSVSRMVDTSRGACAPLLSAKC